MKKLILASTAVLSLTVAHGQVSSSCILPTVLQTAYDKDVHHLAMSRMFQIKTPDTSLFIIPQTYKDTIWEGLSAIFNTTIPERDSVFDIYCVHHYSVEYQPWFFYTDVNVNTSYSWTTAWQNSQMTTGYTQLDNFLATYGFSFVYWYSFGSGATLVTNQQLNIFAINDSLEKFNGVNSASSGVIGDGNIINYNVTGNNREYEFSLGCGDCPAGCTGRYKWKFTVYPNCSVLFNGAIDMTNGQICPSAVNCNISTSVHDNLSKNNSFTITPNPFSTQTTLQTNNPLRNATLTVDNCFGQTVAQIKNISGQTITFHRDNLASGLYFVRLTEENKTIAVDKLVIADR
ncbi:MAG: T9SS type A sorting domain-containing protein [Bacteroidetes bacterium]|nr:T9SS type A sorting domain-containing protein [Bacteroidota bacterium]